MLVFDLESNGLLDTITKVHCLHIFDTKLSQMFRYDKEQVTEGVKHLMAEEEAVVGHNIVMYDLPALKLMYPHFKLQSNTLVLDTLILARLLFPNILDTYDMKNNNFPTKLYGSHSLEAYGLRLGMHKGDFTDYKGDNKWLEWTQGMSDYCVQDVMVTNAMLNKCTDKGWVDDAYKLELDVATIIQRQIAKGFKFKQQEGIKVYGELVEIREEIRHTLQEVFQPWYKSKGEFTPKGNRKDLGYRKGCKLTKIELVTFNPGSRFHVADRFKKLFKWKPTHFTDDGNPKVDETVLDSLPYPEAKLLAKYYMINKRIGQIAEGDKDKAWLHVITDEGRIHGSVNTLGAVSRRMTHSRPNIAQTPAGDKPYGPEFRGLFTVPAGYSLVGCDASGLELRCLGHYMGAYDDGAYTKEILEGDIHTVNQHAAGLPTRQLAKRFIYAFIYGGGDVLLGEIIAGDNSGKTVGQLRKLGKQLRNQFMNNLPALGSLITNVKAKATRDKELKALDGQMLKVRSPHSSLNLLLQSAGAIVMKRGLVILDSNLSNYDASFVANIHDEWQIETLTEQADTVGNLAVDAIRQAGEYYNFRCPLDAEYKVGKSWAETH